MEIGYSWILLVLGSILDIKYKALPGWFLAAGGVLAVIGAVVLKPVGLWEMAGGLLLGVLLFVVSLLTRGALGKGDGIFIGIVGLNLGFSTIFSVFMGALLLAAFLAVLLLIVKRANRKTAFPFLPFLGLSYGIICISSFL